MIFVEIHQYMVNGSSKHTVRPIIFIVRHFKRKCYCVCYILQDFYSSAFTLLTHPHKFFSRNGNTDGAIAILDYPVFHLRGLSRRGAFAVLYINFRPLPALVKVTHD